MRYTLTAFCVEMGCHCLDRGGVILYDGYDYSAAMAAMGLVPSGYTFTLESA
jgi:hypothetical protein